MYVGSYKTFKLSERVYSSGKRQLRTKVTYIFRCESCAELFERRKRKAYVQNDLCSENCRRRETCGDGLIRQAGVATFKKRHGVGAVDHDLIVQKRRQTSRERFGFESPASSPVVQQKFRKTSLQRFGHEHPMQSPDFKRRIDHAAITVKRHATMKRNGTYGSSRPENAMYERLCEKYGRASVERERAVNGWAIDFYVEPIDTYIQLDGTYWHGLDRPLEKIRESKSPRAKVILTTYQRDRAQDAWFAEQGLRLVRVTDVQFARGEVML